MAYETTSTSTSDHFGECTSCGCPMLEELHDGSGEQPAELVCTSCGMAYVAVANLGFDATSAGTEPPRTARHAA